MPENIHPTAIISPDAEIGAGVQVGPYCCIGDNVILGDNVRLRSHVTVDGHTTIGEGTEIFPFASIGLPPQDLKYDGEHSTLTIGKYNRIREYVTMQPGTKGGGLKTTVGDHCLFMAGAHVAHDCHIGNRVNMANYATLSGHITVGNNVTIGGLAAVHQFVRIGNHAFIGGMAGISYDVIPYALVMGRPANLAGLNIVGMRRKGIPRDELEQILQAYDLIFDKEKGTLVERVEQAVQLHADQAKVKEILDFIQADSARNLCMPEYGADTARLRTAMSSVPS
ncbi:MAG: acyl-ACP--UDP-N-acetylglucosamine O-acyltransferase [Pseudomonadota bacterium]